MERKTLEISIDWVTSPGDPSFNSLVIKELKAKGVDFEYDHFFNLRAHNYDLKVNEHTETEDRVRYIKCFESLEYDKKAQEIFQKEVDEAIKNFDNINAIKVCDTPQILLDIGFEQKPWLYSKKHLNDAITPSYQGGHGLTKNQIYSMAEKLEKPCFVLKNRNDKRQDCPIIIFDDVNDEKLPLFLVVQKDGKGNYNFKEIDCNFIKSLYGHDAFERYLNSVIKNNGLIYYDKEKVHNLETLAGVQFSNCISNYEPNKILQHIDINVKKNDKSIKSNIYVEAIEKTNEETGKDTLIKDSAKILEEAANENCKECNVNLDKQSDNEKSSKDNSGRE